MNDSKTTKYAKITPQAIFVICLATVCYGGVINVNLLFKKLN